MRFLTPALFLTLFTMTACTDKGDGGDDGSTGDGGLSDGGGSDGGATDGGTSDGGTSDGGTSDGGTSDGGTSDGGTSDGGTSDGGTADIDADEDGFPASVDCDDDDPGINPDQTEVCDEVDNDCDDLIDDADASVDLSTGGTWYADVDEDGFGSGFGTSACVQPEDSVTNDEDCDDSDAAVNPDATEVCDDLGVDEDCDDLVDDADDSVELSTGGTWYVDGDEDGFGTDATITACEQPAYSAGVDGDCNDSEAGINPDAAEVCDDLDIDENCNDLADDADPSVDPSTQTETWVDEDGDGFGAEGPGTLYCDPPDDVVANALDCDDDDGGVNPDAIEVCDAADTDEDCNDLVDDDDPGIDIGTQVSSWTDADEDGFGDQDALEALSCELPAGSADNDDDCDDGNGAVNPAALEVCDDADTDEDCDGLVDDADPGVDPSSLVDWFLDADGDDFGDEDRSPETACEAPTSDYVADNTDCDDGDTAINPDGTEVCDDADTDEDCDGLVDDADDSLDLSTAEDWYADVDGDGFGDAASTVSAYCDDPGSGEVMDDSDCDDGNAFVYPGAAEICDGESNDCDDDTWISDDGMAAWISDGVAEDWTADLAAGSYGDVVTLDLDSDGQLNLCAGTWYAHIDSSAEVSIRGIGGSAEVTLSGGGEDVIVEHPTTDHLEVVGLTLTEGSACYYGTAIALGSDNCASFSSNSGGTAYFEDLVITGNTHTTSSSGSLSGAVAAWRMTVDMVDVVVYDNTGAGVAAWEAEVNCSASGAIDEVGFWANGTYGVLLNDISSSTSYDTALSSEGCDWGTGDDDNASGDVQLTRQGLIYATYGDDETFECDDDDDGTGTCS